MCSVHSKVSKWKSMFLQHKVIVIWVNTMKTLRRRWIFISGVCSAVVLWTLYTLEFQYLLPHNSVQFHKYFILQSEYPHSIDDDTLLDLQNFEYLLNNVSICSSSAESNPSAIVIIVHTARSHFVERYAVRETWGSIKLYKGWTFNLVFLLGNDPTGNDELDPRLLEESKQFGDLIMGNFVDSYKNLTYKHLMGYKWVNSFCSNSKFILKTDDDVFVDIFQLVETVLIELVYSDNAYACLNMRGNTPVRSMDSVWHVSKELYSGEEYPDFCSGSVYLMKSQVAAKIISVCNQTKFLWIDDVYVTGILREKYNQLVNYTDNKRLDILSMFSRYNLSLGWRSEIEFWCNTGLDDQLRYTFVLLNKNEVLHDMFCIWNKVRLVKFAMNHVIELDHP